MNKDRRKGSDVNATGVGCILGTDTAGEVISIQDIKSECKSVIVEGIIENLNGRESKETNIIFFDVIDETQSIRVEICFHDKERLRRVYDGIRWGMRVRVKGAVRFDTYECDYILCARAIEEVPVTLREDKAQVKRVELHAHTQMSAMDSVAPISKLIYMAVEWGWDAIAITDHGIVQAFPEAMRIVEDNNLAIKVIYGMEGYLTGDDYSQPYANHVMMLVKNQEGLRNLYELVSLSFLHFFQRQPRIPMHTLEEHRKGLILGAAACEEGALVRAICARKSEEELLTIADFYDYLEIQPIGNYTSLVRSKEFPDVCTDEDLRNINRKIAELAKKLGKVLVAAGNVHFPNPEDAVFRTIIQAGKSSNEVELPPPLFLRTTEEMLKEFDYLGKELAYEAVVTNPRRIADMVERLRPIPDTFYLPTIPDSDNTIKELSYQRAHQWYGDTLPDVVQARLNWELDSIIGNGFSGLYLIAHKAVKKSNEDGYIVGSCGAVGSSFVATLTDITEVNPLPPHYRCPKCRYSEFVLDGSYGSGFDLPDKKCPACGEALIKNGNDIPFAVFLGFDGSRIPNISLDFSSLYQAAACKYVEQLFGRDKVYPAGNIITLGTRSAGTYARKYYEEKGKKKRDAFIRHIANGCIGTKRTTKRHSAGLAIVPQDMDVHCFTPLQRTYGGTDTGDVVTHFDCHDISCCLGKIDILGHDGPTLIKMMQDFSGFDATAIPFNDPQTLSLFCSKEGFGTSSDDFGTVAGTLGIQEFDNSFVRQVLNELQPTCFSDLVKILAFSHRTDVWGGNVRDLIRNGICSIHDAIATRDDIMMYLIHKGVNPLLAYKMMETVRKGRRVKTDVSEQLMFTGIPGWYIESCKKIKYLLPRAHAVAHVMMAYRIAYYKVHYPLAFYRAYFSLHAKEFEENDIAAGKETVRRRLRELLYIESLNKQQKAEITALQLAWEMYLRGYTLSAADLRTPMRNTI